jgi:hypothetical protein
MSAYSSVLKISCIIEAVLNQDENRPERTAVTTNTTNAPLQTKALAIGH